jgi:hypothetical protein
MRADVEETMSMGIEVETRTTYTAVCDDCGKRGPVKNTPENSSLRIIGGAWGKFTSSAVRVRKRARDSCARLDRE